MLDQKGSDFSHLSTGTRILAEYVWIGETGNDLHSKTKVLDHCPSCISELPLWHCESCCSEGQFSVLLLKPRAIFPDPNRGGPHILVLCDTFNSPSVAEDGGCTQLLAHRSNNREPCSKIMAAAARSEPVFSVKQQYTLLADKQQGKTHFGFLYILLAAVRVPEA